MIPNDRDIWTTRFWQDRYGLSMDAVQYHMRNWAGHVGHGRRRRLNYAQACRFERYLRAARGKETVI